MSRFIENTNKQIEHIHRVWGAACKNPNLGSWSEVYTVIQNYNELNPVDCSDFVSSNNYLETLDFLQSIAFLRYAEIEKLKLKN